MVSMSESRSTFTVPSESTGELYEVTFFISDETVKAHCTCQAGQKLTLCKHVLKCIDENPDIKIALENMWGRDPRTNVIVPNVCSVAAELADYADALDPDWFTVCLDIGHIGLVREYEAPFIKYLGADRLTCVHIHDNDYISDLHTCPFTGKLPWPWQT